MIQIKYVKRGIAIMGMLELAIKHLREEGVEDNKIKAALNKMFEEAKKEPLITGSLDDYLNGLED